MSSLLLRSVLQQCCRRAYQPVMPLFQIPKRQYFIVPEPDEIDEEEHDFFQDWIEIQKEDIDASEQEAGDFGSDPYPYYRKEHQKRTEARFQDARKRKGRVSIRKVRGLVEMINFKREFGYR